VCITVCFAKPQVKKAHGSSGADLLTRSVLDYVTGETSVTKHNPAFVYKLYLAIGDYPSATHTALLIAADEQKAGDYSGARQVLFDIHQKLVEVRGAIPEELRKNLVLLHSYALVKKFSNKLNPQAEPAARMLMRVAKSISKFPNHQVNILTSAIIWCTK
jgi:WD repeat-containing protein 19